MLKIFVYLNLWDIWDVQTREMLYGIKNHKIIWLVEYGFYGIKQCRLRWDAFHLGLNCLPKSQCKTHCILIIADYRNILW